jgi:PAS domain S-box-containing protein
MGDNARSAALLRSVLETIPAFVASVTLDGRFVFLNRLAPGVDSADLIGKSVFEFIDTEYHERVRRCFERVRETGEPSAYDTRAVGAYGRPAYYETHVGPVFEDGAIVGLTLVATDVTERRSIENQLVQAQKMEAIGQLTAGISHNFNNLLQAIIANLDLAAHTPQEEALTFIADARTAVGRAAELVREMLVFTAESQGVLRVVEADDLVRQVIDLCLRTFDERIVVTHRRSDEPLHIRVDVSRIEQALLNLLINARDVLEESLDESPSVEVSVRRFQPDARRAALHRVTAGTDYVRIRVRDNGHGMSEEVRRRCVEPFFSTKPVGRGTGLGLSTSYRIVSESGGWLEVESAPGVGASFDVCLPVCRSQLEPDSA